MLLGKTKCILRDGGVGCSGGAWTQRGCLPVGLATTTSVCVPFREPFQKEVRFLSGSGTPLALPAMNLNYGIQAGGDVHITHGSTVNFYQPPDHTSIEDGMTAPPFNLIELRGGAAAHVDWWRQIRSELMKRRWRGAAHLCCTRPARTSAQVFSCIGLDRRERQRCSRRHNPTHCRRTRQYSHSPRCTSEEGFRPHGHQLIGPLSIGAGCPRRTPRSSTPSSRRGSMGSCFAE